MSLLPLLLLLATVIQSRPHSDDSRPQDSFPLSVEDGFVRYSVGGNLSTSEARVAFESLRSEEVNRRSERIRRPKMGKKGRKSSTIRPTVKWSEEEVDESLPRGWKNALSQALSSDRAAEYQPCQAHPFKQFVKHQGCLTKLVVNRFCYGSCSSLFLPRLRSKKLKAHFASVAKCAPKEYDTVEVDLDCPHLNPPVITKTIIIVRECACLNADLGPL